MKANNAIGDIIMYSTDWCSDCFRTRAFFAEYGINYREVNIEKDPAAAKLVEETNNGNRSVPTIFYNINSETKTVTEPNRSELEEIFLN